MFQILSSEVKTELFQVKHTLVRQENKAKENKMEKKSKMLGFEDAFKIATSMRNMKDARRFMDEQKKAKENTSFDKATAQRNKRSMETFTHATVVENIGSRVIETTTEQFGCTDWWVE